MVSKKLKLGVVSSGGGLRTYYNAGLFYMLKKYGYDVVHITGASGGITAGAFPYLASETCEDIEEEIKVLANKQHIFNIKESFMTPSLFSTSGGYLAELDKNFFRREMERLSKIKKFLDNLQKVRLDISVTNISYKVENEIYHFNPILLEENDLEKALDIIQATTSIIPITKAGQVNGHYCIDGGYSRNSPMKLLFNNDEVEAIILIDFTNYRKYQEVIDRAYYSTIFNLNYVQNFMDMLSLSMQVSFDACNRTQIDSALFFNNLIKDSGKKTLKIKDRTYYYKEIFTLKPENLEMSPIVPSAFKLAWEYYELGKEEAEKLLKGKSS